MSTPDKNYFGIGDCDGVTVSDLTIDPRTEGLDVSTYADLFKFSCAKNVTATNITVDGGGLQMENAVDMNRECVNVSLINAKLVAGKENAITIKGQCSNILLKDIVIVPGGNCDIELGNWSDQRYGKTTKVTLDNVKRSDNKPIRLRVIHADYPTLINTAVEDMKLASFINLVYWWGKRIFIAIKFKSWDKHL